MRTLEIMRNSHKTDADIKTIDTIAMSERIYVLVVKAVFD